MRILLTGASGFIGGHVLNGISKRYGSKSVIVLTSKEVQNVDYVIYKNIDDFGLDKSYFDDVTHIIHAGAFIPKESSQANDINQCNGNVKYTESLLGFDFRKLVRFINLSTSDVYAVSNSPISEQSLISPVSLYGSSKLYCEEMVKTFSNQLKISFINLRIGHVYGPGEEKYKKVLPLAIRNILDQKPLEIWGDGSDLRSFIFIDDVVQSIVNSIECKKENIDINLVSGVAVSIKELLENLAKISKKKLIFNKRESNHQKRDLVFDNRFLLKTLLNKETDLIHGLEVEYNYMKEIYEANI